MLLYHENEQRLRLEQSDYKLSRMLLDDDWLPLSEYRYDRRSVYAAAINHNLGYRCYVARGGKYESSDW